MSISARRLEYLDVMRATLMMLGVVLHASQVYNPRHTWLVASPDAPAFFYYLSHAITAFRMPAFFFLSGFFSMMLIVRHGPGPFMRARLMRLALPLLTTALTLNALQAWLLNVTGWTDIGFADYFARGEWVQHLWFLVNLLLYASLLTFAGKRAGIAVWFGKLRAEMERIPFPVLLAGLPLLPLMFAALGAIGIPVSRELVGTMTAFSLFQYLAFFIVGCFVYTHEGLFAKFTSQPLLPLALSLSFALALDPLLPRLPALPESVIAIYLHFLAGWLGLCLFLSLFRRLSHRITPGWKYFREASYTVYLFHHLVIVSLGIVFIDLAVPAPVGFALIVAMTLVITFCVHTFLVARYQALCLLFNGKRATERPDVHRPVTAESLAQGAR